MFKILGVDHIGIASTDLADGEFWKLLGLQYTGDETVADQKVTTAFYPTTEDKQHGEIELLVATDETSPIATADAAAFNILHCALITLRRLLPI